MTSGSPNLRDILGMSPIRRQVGDFFCRIERKRRQLINHLPVPVIFHNYGLRGARSPARVEVSGRDCGSGPGNLVKCIRLGFRMSMSKTPPRLGPIL